MVVSWALGENTPLLGVASVSSAIWPRPPRFLCASSQLSRTTSDHRNAGGCFQADGWGHRLPQLRNSFPLKTQLTQVALADHSHSFAVFTTLHWLTVMHFWVPVPTGPMTVHCHTAGCCRHQTNARGPRPAPGSSCMSCAQPDRLYGYWHAKGQQGKEGTVSPMQQNVTAARPVHLQQTYPHG